MVVIFKMLAKEVIEDSLLSFLTQEAPNVEVDGEPTSQKVITFGYYLMPKQIYLVSDHSFGAGIVKDKDWFCFTCFAS